jgi:NADH-quinone oxidoreductase subunit N
MYGSALVATAGGLVLVSTRNLGVMFLAIELIWISHRWFSVGPNGWRSLVTLPSGMSSLALILSLVGFGIYTGHLDVASIETFLLSTNAHPWIPKIAMWIFIIGLTLKMVAMYFDGRKARGEALALMATIQVAVVGAVLRVTSWSLVLEDSWQFLLGFLAVVSFSVGSFLLVRGHGSWSYAQLGQVGAILTGLTVGGEAGRSSVLFYLFAFVFMSVGAIGAAVSLGSLAESDFFSNWRAVAWRHPVLAGATGVLLFSLAGIPPTIGFWSRFTVYLAAIHDGFYVLLAFALLNMLTGIYYYLRPLTEIWMGSSSSSPKPHPVAIGVKLYVLVSAGVVFVLGLAPEFLLTLSKRVALELF